MQNLSLAAEPRAERGLTETPEQEAVRLLTARLLELEDENTKLCRAVRRVALALAEHLEHDAERALRIEAAEQAIGELRQQRGARK